MTKKKEENIKKKATPKPQQEQEEKEKKPSRDASGRFQKGHAKEGGRVAGTPNKNRNIRDRLREQVEPFIDQLGEMLMRVQKEEGTNEMLQRVKDFTPYFMPKMQSIQLGADQDRAITEEQRLTELDARYTKKELSINFKTMTVVNNDKLRMSDPDSDEDDFDLSQLEFVDN